MRRLGAWFVVAATVAMLAMMSFPAAASTRTYSWTLTCKGDGTSDVSWDWLQDGQPISGAGGMATCGGTGSAAGNGTRPTNANGFSATLSIQSGALCISGTCSDSRTGTQSFDPNGPFSTALKVSFNGKCMNFLRRNTYHCQGSAEFPVSS